MNKSMQILDVFFLQNNQTIVVGNIDYPKQISQCRGNLYFNGILTESVFCINENIVKSIGSHNKLRSFLIKETKKLTNKNIHEGRWELEFLIPLESY